MPRHVSYTGFDHDTTEVEKGDLSPIYENIIELAGYEETNYRVEKEKADEFESLYEAELDKVHVAVGDRVKAGDTLVSFKSESLSKELREYEDAKTNWELTTVVDSVQQTEYLIFKDLTTGNIAAVERRKYEETIPEEMKMYMSED